MTEKQNYSIDFPGFDFQMLDPRVRTEFAGIEKDLFTKLEVEMKLLSNKPEGSSFDLRDRVSRSGDAIRRHEDKIHTLI